MAQAIGPETMIAEVPDSLLRSGVDDRGRYLPLLRISSSLLMHIMALEQAAAVATCEVHRLGHGSLSALPIGPALHTCQRI